VYNQIAEAILAFAQKRKYGKKEKYNDFYIFIKIQT